MSTNPLEQDPIYGNPVGSDYYENVKKVEQAQALKASDLLALSLKYWYWILLSIVVFLALGWLKVKKSTPLYTQSTSVLLRDDAQGSGTGSSSINLSDLGLESTSTVIEDEMEALRSPDLMAQVVLDLGLQTHYFTPGTFHDKLLYGSKVPVKVSFPDMDQNENASMTLHIDADENITVEDLHIGKNDYDVNPDQKLTFGDAITSPSGPIIVQKTSFYQPGEEQTVKVVHLGLETAAMVFEGEVNVELTDNKYSNVVVITCTDASVQRADDILSSMLKCYNLNWLESRAAVVAATSEFITQRLNDVEQELSGVDNSISSYKSSNLVPDINQTSRLYLEESAEVNSQILNYNNQLQMAKYLKNYITNEGKFQVLPANYGMNNAHLETQVKDYNALVLQRNSLLANTSESNPLVVDLDSRLASLRRGIISSIDNEIVSLSNTISNMERQERSNTAKVSATPKQAKFLLSAERKQKVQESLYVYLLQKREENELSQSFVSVNTRVLKKPSGPKTPTYPNPARTYILAFVVGLAIPVGTIYVRAKSNTKVRGRKDLETLSAPIVGEIPEWRQSRSTRKAVKKAGKDTAKAAAAEIVVADGNRDLINEAIRVMRSNITRMTGADKSSVLMITSFNPGSGKTFLTMNLGVSLALKGHKILLIDGDLRRASLSRFAGSPRIGVADYLSGTVDNVDSVIKRNVGVEGLDLLPVGAIPPNPTELLETDRFQKMIEHLKEEYRYIFIDCPPGEMMADAQIIGDISDRTLFVVRVGIFERPMLKELERLYQMKKYPGLMLALNGSIIGDKYGYSYSYSYGYGYKKQGKK